MSGLKTYYQIIRDYGKQNPKLNIFLKNIYSEVLNKDMIYLPVYLIQMEAQIVKGA